MDVAKLRAVITADTAQATRDLNQFSGQLDRTASRGQSAGRLLDSAFAGFAGGAAFAGISALTNLIGTGLSSAMNAVGDAAIGLNARLEQSEIGFTTMLGSGEKARAFLDDLANFAAHTPFEFEGLTLASQRMLAFGFAAEDILPLLEDIGSAAAAMGGGSESIDRITRALGQMQAKGRVMSEELLQLTESGIPALQLLADELNVTTAEAQRMVTAGKVSADTFIAAFQRYSDANFGGMMQAQARTFSGAIETIQDSLNLAGARGLEPFFERLSAGAVQLAEFTASDDFDQWSARIAAAIDHAFDAAERFGEIGKEIGAALKPVGELAPLMTTTAGVTVGATQAMAGGWLMLTATMIAGARAAAESVGILADVVGLMSGELSPTDAAGSIADHILGIGNAAVDSGKMTQQGMMLIVDALGTGQATAAGLDALLGDLTGTTRALTEEEQRAAEHTAIAEAAMRGYGESTASIPDINVAAAVSAHEMGASIAEATLNLDAYVASVDTAALMNQAFHNSVSDASGAVNQWKGMLSGAEEALGVLQEKMDSGATLTATEQSQYETLTKAVDRYRGGIENDLVPALIDAQVKQAEYTLGLDNLNAQLAAGEITQAEYNDAVFDLAARTDPAIVSQQNLTKAMEDLVGKIDGLIEKVGALITKYGDIPDSVNTDVTADTSPAEAAIAALLAQQRTVIIDVVTRTGAPPPGMSGPTMYASGGRVPHDQLALVGEQGPELLMLPGGANVVNAADTRRMLSGGNAIMLSMDINIEPAIDSIYELSRYIPHSPAETGPFSSSPDWDWVFRGIEASIRARLDAAIEDAAEFKAALTNELSQFDLWNFVLGNFKGIVSGDVTRTLREQIDLLSAQLALALEERAPQPVIDGLTQALENAQAQINAAMWVSGSDAGRAWAEATAAAAETAIEPLADETVAQIIGMIEAMNASAAGSGTAFAADLLDEVVDGLYAGRVSLEQALQIIPDDLLGSLEKMEDRLTVDLAEALLTGSENAGVLEEHLQILIGLMDALTDSASDAAVAVGTFVPGRGYSYSTGTFTTSDPTAAGVGRGGVFDRAYEIPYDELSPAERAARGRFNQTNVTVELDGRTLARSTSRSFTANHRFTARTGSGRLP